MEQNTYIEPEGFKGTEGEWGIEYIGDVPKISTCYILIADPNTKVKAGLQETLANAFLLANAKEALKSLQDLVKFNDNNSLYDEYANNGSDYAPDIWQSSKLRVIFETAKQVIANSIPKTYK